ncbi:MAG: putative Holliday junction resolvase [Saprospiraceae bacterium]|jgi:putative Holliday junction resolvase
MGRILAIDYGGKRCGMAWTDVLQISNNPLETVKTEAFEEILKEFIDGGEVSDVVFGLPAHADGNLTKIGERIIKIIERFRIKYLEIQFHTIDESFTSVRAVQHMLDMGVKKKKRRQKESVDQMSAVLILRDFLNKI